MHRFRRSDQTTKKENIEEVMNEVSSELGVGLETKSIDEAPKELAKRIERAIKKRT